MVTHYTLYVFYRTKNTYILHANVDMLNLLYNFFCLHMQVIYMDVTDAAVSVASAVPCGHTNHS